MNELSHINLEGWTAICYHAGDRQRYVFYPPPSSTAGQEREAAINAKIQSEVNSTSPARRELLRREHWGATAAVAIMMLDNQISELNCDTAPYQRKLEEWRLAAQLAADDEASGEGDLGQEEKDGS